jgi:hypothetical protein
VEEIENDSDNGSDYDDNFGPLDLQYISKNEILIAQNRTIIIYKINKKSSFKEIDKIETEKTIRNIITKEDNLIVSIDNGDIIIFKKDESDKYIIFKTINFPKTKYKLLLDIKENNLICGFKCDSLDIINISNSNIISKFIFQNKNEEDALHEETQPFLLKNLQNNNYYICFKQVANYCIFDYHKMKFIKKIKVENNLSWTIYKPRDTYNYFFVMQFIKEGFIKIQKISDNLKIVESSKIKFEFPSASDIGDEEYYESDSEMSESNSEITGFI